MKPATSARRRRETRSLALNGSDVPCRVPSPGRRTTAPRLLAFPAASPRQYSVEFAQAAVGLPIPSLPLGRGWWRTSLASTWRTSFRLAVSLESIEQFRVEQRGDLAVSGWEPQPAASVFLPNIARLSSAAAHYESDRTNRNVRFAARHGRFRPQAVQEPETAASGEILRRQTQRRHTGPPPFLPGPITNPTTERSSGTSIFKAMSFSATPSVAMTVVSTMAVGGGRFASRRAAPRPQSAAPAGRTPREIRSARSVPRRARDESPHSEPCR